MIPFSPPRIDQLIIDEVIDTLKSGWITTGPKTKLFEKKLTAYGGHKATLCVNSASAGLELVLRWFGVKEGDEVIIPAYTYAATANVVIHCGAKPVFVDINDDFNISVAAIEKAITSKTKVIMPVDLGGFPCDFDEINMLVNKKDIVTLFKAETDEQKQLGRILILSDAAHSIGGIYKNKKVGSLTDITVYSFHAVKNLTTSEGGAICLNLNNEFDNEEIYKYLNTKSLHGQNKDALAKTQIGNWKYDIVEAGYKCNMTDILASIGLVELDRYDKDMLVKRKHIFDLYTEMLSQYKWAQIPEYSNVTKSSSFHVFLLRIKGISEQERDEIISEIFNAEVSVNVHFVPLPMMSYYKNLGYKIKDYPKAYDNYSREISLPVYYDLTDENVQTVVSAVANAVDIVINKNHLTA
ncbi:MAG: DegT/DnrJ/EryC1/StrS aminotransferase family protein [Bacteroidetes bacterium]|nr:DegT/DnrJ/EryC1/StrS aminotransferase family protein [Bacteroidota bacterium]